MLERLFRILTRLPARQLLDTKYYLSKYPDLSQAGVNPLRHYLEFGAAEGRKPNPLFAPDYYLRRNSLNAGDVNPVIHFLQVGGPSGMSPHPLFDSQAYVSADPSVRGKNPLLHFLSASGPKPAPTEGSQFGCGS
jgi:hypothetical protein